MHAVEKPMYESMKMEYLNSYFLRVISYADRVRKIMCTQ